MSPAYAVITTPALSCLALPLHLLMLRNHAPPLPCPALPCPALPHSMPPSLPLPCSVLPALSWPVPCLFWDILLRPLPLPPALGWPSLLFPLHVPLPCCIPCLCPGRAPYLALGSCPVIPCPACPACASTSRALLCPALLAMTLG